MPESWKLEHPDQIALGEGVRSVRLVAMAGRVNLIGKDGPAALEVTKVSGPPLQSCSNVKLPQSRPGGTTSSHTCTDAQMASLGMSFRSSAVKRTGADHGGSAEITRPPPGPERLR